MSKKCSKNYVQHNATMTGKTTPFESLDMFNTWGESQDNYSIARVLEKGQIDANKELPFHTRLLFKNQMASNESMYKEKLIPLIASGILTYKNGKLSAGPNAGRPNHYDYQNTRYVFDDDPSEHSIFQNHRNCSNRYPYNKIKRSKYYARKKK